MTKKLTLSKPRTRSELIADFKAKNLLLADPPPVAPVKPAVPPAKPTEPAADPDDAVDTAITALKKAFADVQAAQKADPDDGTDPNDKMVDETIAKIAPLIDELTAAQGVDDKDDPPEPTDGKTPSAAPPTKMAALMDLLEAKFNYDLARGLRAKEKLGITNTTPKTNPIADNGDVDPTAVCATDGCGHLATAHSDQSTGANSGMCSMENCSCASFTADIGTATDPEDDDADGDGGAANNAGGDDVAPVTGAHGSLRGDLATPSLDVTPGNAPTPTDTPVVQLAPPDTNPPPDMPGGMVMGPAFTIPVMVIEGQQTGDGRGIVNDALEWGPMPMILMGMATATHDPGGYDQNDPSIMCGRIDSVTRVAGESGTQLITAKGFFYDNDDGMYFADLVDKMGRVGISADIAVIESEETIEGMDEFGWPLFTSTLTKGVIQGCTIVPFPAFTGAYIVLGDGTVIPEIPQTAKDVPVPDLVASGGQLIHWMAEVDCVPCGQGLDVLIASGVPTRPPKAWFENPNFTFGDDRLKEIFVGKGEKRFGGAFACPPTILESGEMFGHIAPWGTCHTGQPGGCVTPPHSKTGYAMFMREGQQVMTAEGELVTVGVLTFHSGHANQGRNVGISGAMAHYDNTATAFADIRIYEDEFGIAYHGALRPHITDEQLREIRAAAPSGDWRESGGNLELVACLQVNQPGFPVAVVADGGRPVSLVAAGAYQMAELMQEAITESITSIEDSMLRLALAPILRKEQERLRQERLEFQKEETKKRFTKSVGR